MVQVPVGFVRPEFGEDTIKEGVIRAIIWAHNRCFVVSRLGLHAVLGSCQLIFFFIDQYLCTLN